MEKIKNFFGFAGSAWSGGIRGKIGVICALFAIFMLGRMFFGTVSAQKFVMNIWHLHSETRQLESDKKTLETYQNHIKLIQSYSPDYVEELGLKYLNIAPSGTKILKM